MFRDAVSPARANETIASVGRAQEGTSIEVETVEFVVFSATGIGVASFAVPAKCRHALDCFSCRR